MSDCIFCKIILNGATEDKFYEDDNFIVIKDIYPKAKVHYLVITKEHIESLAKLEDKHKYLMGELVLLLPKVAEKLGLDTGFRTIVNTGPGGGQEVPHIHFHLLSGGALPSF